MLSALFSPVAHSTFYDGPVFRRKTCLISLRMMPKKWCLSSNQTDNRRASGFIKHRATRGVRHRLYPTVMSVHQSRILMDAIRPVRCQPCATSPWGRDSRASALSCDGAVLPQRQIPLLLEAASVLTALVRLDATPIILGIYDKSKRKLPTYGTLPYIFLTLRRTPGFPLTGDSVSIEADERQ